MGLANYTPPNDGTEIKAKHLRDLWVALSAQVNGNLDSNNFAPGGVTAGDLSGEIPSNRMEDSGDLELFVDETIPDHVVSGCIWSIGSGLIGNMTSGYVRINGVRYSISAINNYTFTNNKDIYVDVGIDGVVDYNEVASGATAPTLSTNHIRLAKVITSGGAITAIYNTGNKVLFDNPYKFSARPTANQTGVTSATWTTVTLATENFDTNNNFASNTYTVPVSGFYQLYASLRGQATTTGNTIGWGVRLIKNGSITLEEANLYDNNVTFDFAAISVNPFVYLYAGDLITMQGIIYCSAGTATFYSSSVFSGYLVSRT